MWVYRYISLRIPYIIDRHKINVIDIETFGRGKIQPYCCCIIYKNKKTIFYGLKCIEKTIEYMFLHCEDKTIFFAHNLTFDGLIIINFLNKDINIKKEGTLLKNCEIYSLTLENKNSKKISFRCSAKILPMSLKDIADQLNLLQKLRIKHENINEDNYNMNGIKNKVIEYCKRDVFITQEFMSKINEEISNYYPGWWIWIYSISGLALKIYDKNFNKNLKLKNNKESDDLIRPAYYGGRCEVFGNPIKGDFIYHYDFSSMYTNMLKEKFPYGDYKINYQPISIDEDGFYLIKVKSSIEEIPILPYRCKETNKLLFPNGIFWGLYWKEEIDLFIKNGGEILEIKMSVTFDKKDFIFKDFSDFCIKNRKKSNLNKIIWKLIPNSFIGRLGLKPKNEKTLIIDESEYEPWKYDVISDKKVNKRYLVRIKTKDNEERIANNVIYPAIITSKARILWWNTAKELIKEGGRILYCDTDSIFVSFKREIINEKHGSIEWIDNKKDTIIEKACFAGNKAYAIKTKEKTIIKIKGTKKNEINYENFEDKFYKSDNIELKYDFFNKKFMDIKIEEIVKKINFNKYDKRIFSDCKKFTKPIEINENTLYNE